MAPTPGCTTAGTGAQEASGASISRTSALASLAVSGLGVSGPPYLNSRFRELCDVGAQALRCLVGESLVSCFKAGGVLEHRALSFKDSWMPLH